MNFDIPSLLQLFINGKELLHNSFFQHDFVSKLNEAMKVVTPIKSTKTFLRKDDGFI